MRLQTSFATTQYNFPIFFYFFFLLWDFPFSCYCTLHPTAAQSPEGLQVTSRSQYQLLHPYEGDPWLWCLFTSIPVNKKTYTNHHNRTQTPAQPWKKHVKDSVGCACCFPSSAITDPIPFKPSFHSWLGCLRYWGKQGTFTDLVKQGNCPEVDNFIVGDTAANCLRGPINFNGSPDKDQQTSTWCEPQREASREREAIASTQKTEREDSRVEEGIACSFLSIHILSLWWWKGKLTQFWHRDFICHRNELHLAISCMIRHFQ